MRSLAHVEEIVKIDPIPNYDRVEYAQVQGWHVVISKADNLKVGDKVVFFEIDSLVPENDPRFEFLANKHYKIKTQKLCKVLSQGLAMPLTVFPELGDPELGTDVTEKLGVKYYVPEDNTRKANIKYNSQEKYNNMFARMKSKNPDWMNKWYVKKLRKSQAGKKVLYFFFGKNKLDLPKQWPDYIKKSDQTRIENMPFILKDRDARWEVTEKLDGSSASYGVKRKSRFRDHFDFAVCSRNVRKNPLTTTDVFCEMAERYNIEEALTKYAINMDANTVYIQGEIISSKIQGNPYLLQPGEKDFYLFELVVDGEKHSYADIKEWAEDYNMKSVPLLKTGYSLFEDMETMKDEAEGQSEINSQVKREGLVYRHCDDPDITFKNVSNSYLLKHS